MGDGGSTARVDRWLWSIRLYKSRAEATNACRAGHVRVDGRVAKPATTIATGDRVEARAHDRDRIVIVLRVIDSRVGAPIAAECYEDHSPPPPARDEQLGVFATEAPDARPNESAATSTAGAAGH